METFIKTSYEFLNKTVTAEGRLFGGSNLERAVSFAKKLLTVANNLTLFVSAALN
jgi:hypothetical protein